MNTSAPAHRFRLLFVLAPLIALALGSFWLYEVMRRASDDIIPQTQRTDPDFFVEKFSYVRMSRNGQAQYHFSGEKMTHNPQDDSYDIVKPVMRNLSNPQAPTTMRADRGKVNNDNTQVHLYDNVEMNRPRSAEGEPLRVRSEYLLILPDDDIVKTDKPVEIAVGPSRLTGTGMVANNATRELQLTSSVHGTYQPAAR